mgnify:CR=1 FL=1
MKNKSINQVSIINGEDGPTSVFIFGEAQKQMGNLNIGQSTITITQAKEKPIFLVTE